MTVYVATNTRDTLNATVLHGGYAVPANITDVNSPTLNPRRNATTDPTASKWQAGGRFEVDCGSAVLVDGCGIAAHTLSGVTVSIWYSTNNSNWTQVHYVTPSDNSDMFFIWQAVRARYWRIEIGSPAIIGNIKLGKRLIFPHAPMDSYTPLSHSKQWSKMFNDSIGGQFLGQRKIAGSATTSVDLGWVDRKFVETDEFYDFESAYAEGETFYYASCPAMYPKDAGYCRAGSDDGIVAVEYTNGASLATVSFDVRAYVGR